MAAIDFEWDPTKALANIKKHGVTFEEARSVFLDERALMIADPDHSAAEDRFVLLGLSAASRVLVVVHCYRQDESTIRLISARRATRPERETYTTRWER